MNTPTPRAPRVVLGPLKTPTQVRSAFRRLGQAVLDGKIQPKTANSAMYAVAGASRALELEVAERMSRQLDALSGERHAYPALTCGSSVVEGEYTTR